MGRLASKQLHILHAEDNKGIFDSCRKSILCAFDKENLAKPDIENVIYCNAIHRRMCDMKEEGKVYDILLLDLELLDKVEYNGLAAIDGIRNISPHTKIFVLSGNIYDRAYNAKLQEYKKQGKIEGFFETANHEEWCGQLIDLVMARQVGILHFSDMHISKNGNSKQILTDFAQNFDKNADLLIFSGDVANRGAREEFEEAENQLMDLCDSLKIKYNVFVPGNHDIKRNTPAKNAFREFLHFRRGMDEREDYYDEKYDYPDGINFADYINTVKVYPSLRTIVCGLNSATSIEDDKFGYSYGEITEEQLCQAERKLKEIKKKYPNYLVIVTFHHNIFEPPYYFDQRNQEGEIRWIPPVKNQGLILKKCFENEANLLLVGHSHVSSVYSIVSHTYGSGTPLHILSAGLFSEKGVTPLEPELRVNYLSYQIDLSGTISDIYCQPYSLNLTGGNWKAEKGYHLGLPMV